MKKPSTNFQININLFFSSFQIEVNAIRDGLNKIIGSNKAQGEIINVLSDSQSALKHLYSLSSKPRVVSQAVHDLVKTVERVYEANARNLNFYWVPGHCKIEGNEEADRVAKKGLNNNRDMAILQSVPRTRIKHFNKFRTQQQFKKYLRENVKQSHWSNYPSRRYFKISRSYDDSNNRRQDISLFRMRTGHNRLGRHLSNINMEEQSLCRFCHEYIEDCYHILLKCTSIGNIDAKEVIDGIRTKFDTGCRKEFDNWLFSQTNDAIEGRRLFIGALESLGVKL